jgi:hypothetical protein
VVLAALVGAAGMRSVRRPSVSATATTELQDLLGDEFLDDVERDDPRGTIRR